MKRVAVYFRVPTGKDDPANSFESQQRYFREYIKRHPDWELQEIYADEGVSSTSKRKRARFDAMIQAAKEGKIDLIVTKEASRFAPNITEMLQYSRELKSAGIGIYFILDDIDTLSAEGDFRLTIMSSILQEERRKPSEHTKWIDAAQSGVRFLTTANYSHICKRTYFALN